MSSRAWVVAGAVVVAAITLVVVMRPTADSPVTSAALPEPLEDRGRVVVPEEVPAPVPTRESPPVEAPSTPPTPARLSEEAAQYREAARSLPAEAPGVAPFIVADQRSFDAPPVFAEFSAEPTDPDWAPGARTDVLSKLAEQPGLELLALQVECRTTMCQVQLTQPSSASSEPPVPILNSLGMQLRFIMALKNQPSMQTSVAYLMRPGHAVPPPPGMRQHAEEPPVLPASP